MTPALLPYLYGGLTMACLAIALFFVRYHRLARDELFVWFAAAFAVFAVQWGLLAFGVGSEQTHIVYVLRLLGFGLIGISIVRKNGRSA